MPPEPLPWDRKDFISKDRKHDRGAGYEAVGGGSGSFTSSTPRWREPYHGHRDFPRGSPRRPPPGYYRQSGNYHQVHGDDARPGDRYWPEDENYRPSFGRYNGNRSNGGGSGGRESRGYFRRPPYWDSGDFSRAHHDPPPPTAPRSIAVPVTPVPQTQPQSRDVQEKPVSTVDDDALVDNASATCKKSDQDHSLGSISWKPLKWTRSASISSLKAARSEVDESGREAKETPTRSSAVSPQESEDGVAKKKQRLGWGQGLAKYEKQKVGGSDDGSTRNGLVPCDSSSKSTLSDTSPKDPGPAGCLSPVTRSSIACSSSPGAEDKPCVRASDPDTTDLSGSSIIDSQNSVKEFLFEHYEADPMGTLNKVLTELLQPEDSCSGDSTFTRHTAISKLLLLKGDVSKELEKTECDIDLFENELKSLDFDGNNDQSQVPCTPTVIIASEPCGESADGTSVISVSSATVKDQQIASISTQVTESLDDCDAGLKDAGSDSSDTVSSKLAKASLGKAISDCDSQIVAVSPLVEDVDFRDQLPDPFPPAADCIGRDENDAEDANFGENSCRTGGPSFFSAIMESNQCLKEEAKKGLPNDAPLFDFWKLGKLASLQANDMLIKEKLASRKHRLKFKELALTLKYRAFHHLWAEDLRLLSIRKYRSKSQKRIEPSNRLSQSSSQKHRSSFRSRFALPAGNLTLVPTSEIVDYTKQLKSDSKLKVYRSNLKMPALILDDESRKTVFVTHNGLIDDPIAFEKEKKVINPWMPEEREVFMEMLATLGKDFSKIASFLKHKTTADCVEFYYKNHKSDSFREVMKCLALRKQWQLPVNNYLSTSGKRSQRDVNAVPLDMLEAASMVAAHNNETTGNRQKFDQRSGFGNYNDFRMASDAYGSVEKVDLLRHEKETTAADALAGIRGALSSEAMSPWIASSIGPTERLNFVMHDRPLTPGVTQSIDEEEAFSDEGFGEFDSADWTDAEKTVFIRALSTYGKDFARISHCVATRTKEQCKIFFSKARKCLGLDILYQGPCNGATPRSDTNGGRSDTDDGFAAEMDSAVCSTQSCSRVDTEITQSVVNIVGEDFADDARNLSLQMEMDRSSEHHASEGIDQEEIETKATDLDCDLDNNGLMRLEDDSRPDPVPMDASDAAVGNHRSVSSGGVVGFVADTELKKGGNCPAGGLSSETVSLECFATDCLKPETVEMTHGRSNEENCPTIDVINGTEMQELDSESVERQGMKIGTDSNKNGSLCFETASCADETASCLGNKVSACSSSIFPPNYCSAIQQDLLPSIQKRYPLNPVKQDGSVSVPVLPDPSSSAFGDPVHTGLQSNLIYEGHKQRENSVTRKLYQQYFLGSSTLNQISHTLQVLTGYPLQSVDQKEFKQEPEMISGRSEMQQNCQKGNGISPSSGIFDIGLHNLKSDDLKISHPRSEILGSGRNDEQPNKLPKSCSQGSFSENEEQSRQTGDVKLFGKILSNPSLQKSKSTSFESSDGKPPGQKRDSAQKPSNCQNDATAVASLSHSSRHSSPADIPVRSYGFWDGNRIQTGFSSLPESAVLLTKLQGPLAGLSFYPTKDALPSSNRVLTEYQQAYTQPVSSGGPLPGFQQQGRTARQGNAAAVVGGGILANGGGSGGSGGSNAGGCTAVSDPVAAIKMHYGRRAKLLASLEPWRQTDR